MYHSLKNDDNAEGKNPLKKLYDEKTITKENCRCLLVFCHCKVEAN